MTKVRKQIYLEPHQDEHLKEMSVQTGQSEAELIRQAIDVRLNQLPKVMPYSRRGDLDLWQQEKHFIQARLKQDFHGRRDWSRDDLYDR